MHRFRPGLPDHLPLIPSGCRNTWRAESLYFQSTYRPILPVNNREKLSNYLPQFMSPEDGSALLSGLSPQCSQLQVTDAGTGKLTFNLTDG